MQRIADLVWGPWSLVLFLGTGTYLMIKMRFLLKGMQKTERKLLV